jgi:hypothetical protein
MIEAEVEGGDDRLGQAIKARRGADLDVTIKLRRQGGADDDGRGSVHAPSVRSFLGKSQWPRRAVWV